MITIIAAGICGACVLLAGGAVYGNRRRTRRILENMNRMLETALKGEFTEESFDESLLSAVESRLAHYLAASTVSAQNVRREKESLQTLIADISHQTKTPVANILLYTQLLCEQPDNPACLQALQQQTEKLQSLIDALVKISRLETGILAMHPVRGSLQAAAKGALLQIAPKADAKGIRVILEPGDGDAVFDPKWTEEAVYNLLDNAVKYTGPGGQVQIRTENYELFSVIHVSDNGPGISEDEQPKVFQRFYRGAAHAEEEGVGIGLYLVRQIAARQGGYVKVTCPREGGSIFSLFLPRDGNLSEL